MCNKWFSKSNHEGHEYTMRIGYYHHWSCGNSHNLSESAFWKRHSGYKELTKDEAIEENYKVLVNRAETVISKLWQYLALYVHKIKIEEAQNNIFVESILYIGLFLEKLATISTYFIDRIWDNLITIYPKEGIVEHRCEMIQYIDEDHKEIIDAKIAELEIDTEVAWSDFHVPHPWIWSLFGILVSQKINLMPKLLILKLVKNHRLKTHICFEYVSRFKIINFNSSPSLQLKLNYITPIFRDETVTIKLFENESLANMVRKN